MCLHKLFQFFLFKNEDFPDAQNNILFTVITMLVIIIVEHICTLSGPHCKTNY